ncbi:MAG: nucleotidyltransferase family protein [Bacteroidetes bacterium]|nr:nucleotidyltransferase family protein [Bacteroidota bacterium]
MSVISAIILAAGESKRMGYPKMLLDFGGITMLEKVIRNVKAALVDDIIVVLGAYRDEIQEIAEKSDVRYCYNDIYKEGMLSSVQCGFRNIKSDTVAVLVFQGDQPLITPEVTGLVINKFRNGSKGILMPTYKKRRGHPLLIAGKYFGEIEKLDPGKGLRSLSEIFSTDVEEVEVDDATILRDFDTFEEYNNEINKN